MATVGFGMVGGAAALVLAGGAWGERGLNPRYGGVAHCRAWAAGKAVQGAPLGSRVGQGRPKWLPEK